MAWQANRISTKRNRFALVYDWIIRNIPSWRQTPPPRSRRKHNSTRGMPRSDRRYSRRRAEDLPLAPEIKSPGADALHGREETARRRGGRGERSADAGEDGEGRFGGMVGWRVRAWICLSCAAQCLSSSSPLHDDSPFLSQPVWQRKGWGMGASSG
jgi:hypothetical protein